VLENLDELAVLVMKNEGINEMDVVEFVAEKIICKYYNSEVRWVDKQLVGFIDYVKREYGDELSVDWLLAEGNKLVDEFNDKLVGLVSSAVLYGDRAIEDAVWLLADNDSGRNLPDWIVPDFEKCWAGLSYTYEIYDTCLLRTV